MAVKDVLKGEDLYESTISNSLYEFDNLQQVLGEMATKCEGVPVQEKTYVSNKLIGMFVILDVNKLWTFVKISGNASEI